MQNAGDVTAYFSNNNIFFANLKYCFSLNTHSLYFGICYHVEMLLLASIGYIMAFYHLESLIVFHRKALLYSSILLMFCCLFLIFWVFDKANPFFKITFFVYILSLSVCFVLGFYALTKKYNALNTALAGFGRRSLTIYLLQNFLICTIWLWEVNADNNLFYVYCFGQILIIIGSRFFTKNGIGLVEYYWRVWSLK